MENSLLWLAAVHPRKLKHTEISSFNFRSWKSQISAQHDTQRHSLRTAGILLLGLVRIFLRHSEILHALCMQQEISDQVQEQAPKRRRQSTAGSTSSRALVARPEISEDAILAFPDDPEIFVEPAVDDFVGNFSPFSPRHSAVAPEEAMEFPATPEEISDSVERLAKRQRLSILSDVMDDLRGEEISDRRESERFPTARLSEITSHRPSLASENPPRIRRSGNSTRVELPRKFRDRNFPTLNFRVTLDLSNLLPIPVRPAPKVNPQEISDLDLGDFQVDIDAPFDFQADFDAADENDAQAANIELSPQRNFRFASSKSSGNFSDFVSPGASRKEAARTFFELLGMASRGEAEISGNFQTPLTIRIFTSAAIRAYPLLC